MINLTCSDYLYESILMLESAHTATEDKMTRKSTSHSKPYSLPKTNLVIQSTPSPKLTCGTLSDLLKPSKQQDIGCFEEH
jgi:hypothetical protein